MCGRYVTPDQAAIERAYNLTARQWQSWMATIAVTVLGGGVWVGWEPRILEY
jgi:hypothetical protein